jgi:acyloxyacyl hydrolase
MTTVPEFTANVEASLAYLDTVLPAGSHVAFLGLADGRVLWDTTSNISVTHPLGVKYPALYDFLACTGSTPCWGWMNSNETWRNFTSQRAAQLTGVYDAIIANRTYTHFDMYRLDVR